MSVPPPLPSNPALAAHDAALAEDQAVLARWHEDLAARREERTTLQARHRDRLEDALDHLESLRKNARDRQADIAAIGQSSAAGEGDRARGRGP